MEPVDIGRLVADTIRLLKETMPATVQIHVDSSVPEAGGWVWGNQAQLQQVLVNLVLNARDAMPIGGGQLGDRCRADTSQRGTGGAGTMRLGVIDSGIGITEDARERIFEPFFTTKTRGRGTGLGLAVVAAVVREYGGQIRVDSTPGQGTSVTLDLPAIDPVGASKRTETGPETNVLVALADSYAADLLVSALAGSEYQVRSVHSALELTAAVRTDQWDLVLVDSDLSAFEDEELIEILESQIQSSHVVVVGQVDADLFERRLGPDVLVVNKPFLITELMRLIASLTKFHGQEESANTGSR